MSSLASRTFSDAFDQARSAAFLNDPSGQVYDDAALLQAGATVFLEIQDEFALHGIPIVEHFTSPSDAFDYVAGDDTIEVPTGIEEEFSEPLELWEESVNGGNAWIPMQRVAQLPAPPPNNLTYLGVWEWSEDLIKVLPCTRDIRVLVRYRRELAYLDDAGTPVGFDRFYNCIAPGVSYYVLGPTGRPGLAATCETQYRKALLDSIRRCSRDRQSISFRQQGYNQRNGYGPWVIKT